MMNENNEVFSMEDEPVATAIQNMLKGSKWLSAFLESYRPPLDGEHYLTDREVAEMLRVSRRTLQEYRNNRMLVQQYPVFPFCMNITYACLFSFESAFSTSHMRNTCV